MICATDVDDSSEINHFKLHLDLESLQLQRYSHLFASHCSFHLKSLQREMSFQS